MSSDLIQHRKAVLVCILERLLSRRRVNITYYYYKRAACLQELPFSQWWCKCGCGSGRRKGSCWPSLLWRLPSRCIRTAQQSCGPEQKTSCIHITKWLEGERREEENNSTFRTPPWSFPKNATVWSFSTATATAVSRPGLVSSASAFNANCGLLARGEGRKSAPHL